MPGRPRAAPDSPTRSRVASSPSSSRSPARFSALRPLDRLAEFLRHRQQGRARRRVELRQQQIDRAVPALGRQASGASPRSVLAGWPRDCPARTPGSGRSAGRTPPRRRGSAAGRCARAGPHGGCPARRRRWHCGSRCRRSPRPTRSASGTCPRGCCRRPRSRPWSGLRAERFECRCDQLALDPVEVDRLALLVVLGPERPYDERAQRHPPRTEARGG